MADRFAVEDCDAGVATKKSDRRPTARRPMSTAASSTWSGGSDKRSRSRFRSRARDRYPTKAEAVLNKGFLRLRQGNGAKRLPLIQQGAGLRNRSPRRWRSSRAASPTNRWAISSRPTMTCWPRTTPIRAGRCRSKMPTTLPVDHDVLGRPSPERPPASALVGVGHRQQHRDRKQRVGPREDHRGARRPWPWSRRRPRPCPAPSSGSAR